MSLAKRKVTINIKPSIVISRNGNTWSIAIDMKLKGIETFFVEGQDTDTCQYIDLEALKYYYCNLQQTSLNLFLTVDSILIVEDSVEYVNK